MPTPVKSEAVQTLVTSEMRERSLGIGALPKTLDIKAVHPERKSGYQSYLSQRRQLMASYNKALFASNDAAPARAVQQKISMLDATQQQAQPRTTIDVRFSSIAKVGPGNYQAFFDVCETKPGKPAHCVMDVDHYDFDVRPYPEIYERGQVGIAERMRVLRAHKE